MNDQYWMRRDRDLKMEFLYGRPLKFPENDLKPRHRIVENLIFSALLVGILAIIYFIVKCS